MRVERLNVAGDGKRFYCEFIREGPVNQGRHGIEVIRRETIQSCLDSMLGKPLLVKHVDTDIDPQRLNAIKHGTIDKVGFNQETGFFFCEGTVDTDDARKAAQTMRPSCGFDVLGYVRGAHAAYGGRWNNIAFDREVTALEFHHLALENIRPRYEEADFRLNAVIETQQGKTMSFFKLFKKKPAAEGVAETTEEFQIPADTEITLENGSKQRLNALVEDSAELAKIRKTESDKLLETQRLNAVAGMSDDTEIEIAPGKRVKLGVLRAAGNSQTEADRKAAEDAKELQRLNAVETAAGRAAFATLEAAAARGSLQRLNTVPPEPSSKRGNY